MYASQAQKEKEVSYLKNEKCITIISNRTKVVINISTILYVMMIDRKTEIHVSGGKVYETRITMDDIKKDLDDRFIKIHRGCIVSAMAIHDITDKINLSNGESLIYTKRKKGEIIRQFKEKQKLNISTLVEEGAPETEEEYINHYSSFEKMPFAFADIEMIFNDELRAVDWIFRYGNPALARLENISLEKLIGSSFGSLFANMDSKWLRSYERATLYGEIIEIIDFSPEIEKYLKVICFPTFRGHCGCILFDVSEIKFMRSGTNDAEKALMMYFSSLPKRKMK